MDEERTSRPATYDDLLRVIQALNAEGADYVLIGGYALFAHGYNRATTDIDILVPPTLESAKSVKRALLLLPEGVARDIDPSWFEEGNTIRVADEFVVDVMFNACGESYQSLQAHAQTVLLDGIPVKTVDLEGLLKTKQTVRSKDAGDRYALERALAEQRRRQGHD
jgi:predicted nucleotidyltransferase